MSQEPSLWQLRSDLDKLRSDHESAYREQQRLRRDLDDAQKDIKALLIIPVEVRNLTTSMDKLSERLETFAAAAQTGQRWAWSQLAVVGGLMVSAIMAAITIARLH